MPKRKVVGIDFDGVIADYSQGWLGECTFGDPLPGAVDALRKLHADGWYLSIHTARKAHELGAVAEYLGKHGIPYDEVTREKPHAHCYVDDRAIRFDGNWARTLYDVLEFEPYYYRVTDKAFSESGSGHDNKIMLVTRVHKEATDEKMPKLRDEIHFIERLPDEWRCHFPEIILSEVEDGRAYYEMPHYALPSFRRLIVSGAFGADDVMGWLARVLDFAFEMYRAETLLLPETYMRYMYFDRVRRRLNELRRKSPLFRELVGQDRIVVNETSYPNLPRVLPILEGYANRVLPEFVSRWGHADLHFSNILVDRENDNFILIDPRGYPYCDYYYDYGKLWHSVNSKYEMIAEGQFTLGGGLYQLDRNAVYDVLEGIKAGLPALLCQHSNESPDDVLRKTEFAEAMHFAAIAPFLLAFDGVEKKALAGYYTGVILCNEFVERYL